MDVRPAVITANVGSFERQFPHVPQTVPYEFYSFDDSNFPRRDRAMSPRLQARIPKMFSWQMAPGHAFYIWIDASMIMARPDTVQWFMDLLGDADIAVFKHPDRHSIKEEAEYLKQRLAKDCTYITPRYKNELIDEQLKEIDPYGMYKDDALYASTAFIYRNTYDTHQMFKEWWYHTSRYHIIDQLSFPAVLKTSHCKIKVVEENCLKTPYLSHVRKRKQ